MRVQKARLPWQTHPALIVVGDDFLPIQPIQQFLDHIENVERSPNIIRSYANQQQADVKKRWGEATSFPHQRYEAARGIAAL
jgi:hypothetical protein